MSQVSISYHDSGSVFSNSSWSNLSSSSELVLRDRLRGMVTQFRKEMSESKSLGIDEEVRLYDVNASPASPDPSFLSAYPIRYDDCTD